MIRILIISAYVVSCWTSLAILIDTLVIVFSRDITAIGWYACNPLCLWKLPALKLSAFTGILVWLVSIVITILTALFLV